VNGIPPFGQATATPPEVKQMAIPTLTLHPHARMPALDGATGWLNTEPLTTNGLRGRVVLVDFWTGPPPRHRQQQGGSHAALTTRHG
jgi:hypothetical protein